MAGIKARITPALLAVVSDTPNNMSTENKKLPNHESKKISHLVWRFNTGSSTGLRSHGNMASAPMPNRSHATSSTGKTATSGLDSATYAPTSAMLALSAK